MGLLDKFRNEKIERDSLSEKDVLQEFRQACWDLYISNLPDPIIIDANNPKTKKYNKLPDELKDAIPRGFSIDPKTWIVYFNVDNMPKHITDRNKQKKYSRSIFHHEDTHFTQVPADGVTEAILIDSALKGFRDQRITQNKELASAFAFLVMNIMGDLIGDTLLAKEAYGREDFGDLTLWRQRETVKEARQTPQSPSLLWQTLISTYEKLWQEDLGLDNHIQKRDRQAENTANDLVSILGNDWKDRKTWEHKIRKFATTLESIIKQSARQAQNQKGQSRYKGKGSGKGSSVPDDIITQMGNPTESPLDKKGAGKKRSEGKDDENGKGVQIDERVLEEIYQRNKEAPGKFAGTMGALHKLDPDDALRLMYRARAKELLMSIKEKENQQAERAPAYQTTWNIGDPIIGKGGLEIIPSIMTSGKPVPGQ